MMEREGIVMCSFEDEDLRLEELYQLDILHTPPEETFDRITQMMSSIFKTPIALVSLVTKDAQWFKSSYGLPEDLQNGTEREVSFCQHVVAMKKSLVVEDATKDERFKRNRLVTRQEGIRFYAATPLVTKNNNVLGTVCIIDTKPRSITVVDMKILRGFADSTIQLIEDREMLNLLKSRSIFLIEKNKELRELSVMDTLTGIFNRRFFDESLKIEIARAARQKQPLTLIMIDIDRFKAYNDNYGHVQGDKCLKQVSEAIRSAIYRSEDVVARYGGEEFAVLLPNTELQGGHKVASKIQKALAALALPHKFSDVAPYLTVSQGVCTIHPKGNLSKYNKAFVNTADKQLYLSKKNGRNWICSIAFVEGTDEDDAVGG